MSIAEQGFLSPDIAAYIAKHRAENQAWFDHAMDLNSIAQQLLLEFQVKGNQTLWAALLFVRGLSSFQTAILLAERGMVQDARTIVRSCFETVLCFGALHKDPGFLEKFEKQMSTAKERLPTHCAQTSWSLILPKYSASSSTVWSGRARRESDLNGIVSLIGRGWVMFITFTTAASPVMPRIHLPPR